MKKLLPAQRFTPNFLLLKRGVVGGYRPTAEGKVVCGERLMFGRSGRSKR
ncbi:MAG: hypothetical protein K0M66_05715 [Thiobacillus sp.]|nr:hypothetical protein [Thiobacillus sp.]